MKGGCMDMQALQLDFKKIFFIIILFLFVSSPVFAEDINLDGKFGIGSSNTGTPVEFRYWFNSGFGIGTGFNLDIYDKNNYNYTIVLETPIVLKKINNLFLELVPKVRYYKHYEEYYYRSESITVESIAEVYSVSLGFYSEYFLNNNLSIILGLASSYKWETGFTKRQFYILDPSPFILGFKFYFN